MAYHQRVYNDTDMSVCLSRLTDLVCSQALAICTLPGCADSTLFFQEKALYNIKCTILQTKARVAAQLLNNPSTDHVDWVGLRRHVFSFDLK